jgi:hypothetical protein
MTATTWRRGRVSAITGLQYAALVSAALMVAQCSAVPLDNGTQPGPPANYGVLVAATLRGFKDFANYSNFQISGLRWVHAANGWSWLACVRFADHGRQRFYAFFLDNSAVISSRYDVRTDRCPAQQYAPLDPATGTIAAPSMAQPPVMAQPPAAGALPQPSFTLQQPIY